MIAQRLAQLVLRHRVACAVALLAITAVCASVLPSARLSLSIAPLLRANADLVAAAEEVDRALPKEHYGTALILEWPTPVGRQELEFVSGLAESIGRTRALPDIPVLDRSRTLPIPRQFATTVEGDDVLEAVRSHPLLAGRLISHDGRSLVVMCQSGPSIPQFREFLHAHIPTEVRWRLISGEAANEVRRTHLIHDIFQTVAIELLLFSLLLPLLFRSLRSVIVPLGCVIVAMTLSFGSLAFAGLEFTIIDCAVPGLIVVIGLSDAVHMMHRFEEALARGTDRRAAIHEMLDRVGSACVLTSVTTAIGFLSLLVAEHEAVRAFGLKAAYSVSMTLLTTLTLIPIGLSFWPARRAAQARLPGITRFDYSHTRLVLLCTGVAVVLGALGIARTRVDSRWLEELPPNDPLAADLRWFEENFHGFMFVEFQVRGPLRDPDFARSVDTLGARVVAQTHDVTHCESYTTWIRELTGDPERLGERDVERGLAGLQLLGELFPADRVTEDFTRARLTFTTHNITTTRYFELGEEVRRVGASLDPPVQVELCGHLLVAQQSVRMVSGTLLKSLAVSIAAITLLIALIYRSARLAMISIVPNALPILIALGLTGWLDIPVRIGIVMLYSLGLGLAVDDTIHVLTRFRQEQHPGRSTRQAMLAALRSSGGALIITSMILGLGSLCHLPASFQSLKDVGIIMSSIVVTALLADLYLLPLMVERWVRAR